MLYVFSNVSVDRAGRVHLPHLKARALVPPMSPAKNVVSLAGSFASARAATLVLETRDAARLERNRLEPVTWRAALTTNAPAITAADARVRGFESRTEAEALRERGRVTER